MILEAWLGKGSLTAGDWPYLYPGNIAEFSFPPKWPFLWITPFYQLTAKIFVQYFGFSWELTERLVWFWPFWIIAFFSCWYLSKVALGFKSYWLIVISYLLFTFNTYILTVVAGGQMGVAMAYALVPLVLGTFIRESFGRGLILGIQLMFDPRIALVTLLVMGIYVVLNRLRLKSFLVPLLIAFGLNFFWIFPTVRYGLSFIPEGLTSPEGFKFLSIADFSHGLALLHPNWPEHVFGKVFFMKPEFLILPILAYAAILFAKNNRQILPFAILGLIGAFLAKGVNPPAGFINLWLFNHVPGLNLFRDPTKFYTLVALSYSVLVPFSISAIHKRSGSAAKIFLLLVISYLLFLIRPLWLGELGGTFKAREVPQEYISLKNFLVNDQSFGKVLWLPHRQRFGFYSNNHPAVELEQFIADDKCLEPFCSLKMKNLDREYFKCFPTEHCFPADASFLANPRSPSALADLSIKYLVIPYDSEGEIFVKERKYYEPSRRQLVEFVDGLDYLEQLDFGGKINVYRVSE